MKWNSKDMDIFLKAREYVDTAVMPLFPFPSRKNESDSSNDRIYLVIILSI